MFFEKNPADINLIVENKSGKHFILPAKISPTGIGDWTKDYYSQNVKKLRTNNKTYAQNEHTFYYILVTLFRNVNERSRGRVIFSVKRRLDIDKK